MRLEPFRQMRWLGLHRMSGWVAKLILTTLSHASWLSQWMMAGEGWSRSLWVGMVHVPKTANGVVVQAGHPSKKPTCAGACLACQEVRSGGLAVVRRVRRKCGTGAAAAVVARTVELSILLDPMVRTAQSEAVAEVAVAIWAASAQAFQTLALVVLEISAAWVPWSLGVGGQGQSADTPGEAQVHPTARPSLHQRWQIAFRVFLPG